MEPSIALLMGLTPCADHDHGCVARIGHADQGLGRLGHHQLHLGVQASCLRDLECSSGGMSPELEQGLRVCFELLTSQPSRRCESVDECQGLP